MALASRARPSAPRPPEAQETHHGKWWPLAVVCIAVFMLLIDITVVNVALPQIQTDLHASFSQLEWVVDAYALMLSVLQLTAGTIGDRFGRKTLFLIGIGIFTIGSALCGLAPTAVTLDFFRALQGVGGAVMFATSLALIGENYTGKDRGTAFGMWGLTAGVSIAAGPLIGGGLTSGIDWRWIFWVNVPIGVVAVFLAANRLVKSRIEQTRHIDWPGLLLSGGALTTLVYALIEGVSVGWRSAEILSLLSASAVLWVAFVVTELKVAEPMLDVRLFRRFGFTGAQVAAFAIAASLFSMFLYLTIYLQDILGFSALGAGLRLLPITALTLVAAPIAGRLSSRIAYRYLLGAGLALVGVGLLLMHGVTVTSSWTALLPGFVLAGLGSGVVNPPLGSLAVSVVEQSRSGMGAGVNNSFRQVGLATGIAALGTIFVFRIEHLLTTTVPQLPPAKIAAAANAISAGSIRTVLSHSPPGARQAVARAARAAFVSGLNDLLLIAAAVAIVGAAASLILVRQKDLLSGH